MSKNDVDAVQIEYRDWLKERSEGLPADVNRFEFFCAEKFLKDFNLSDEEVMSGIVGGSLDGGCDALFFLVGGKCVRDDSPIPEQRDLTANLILLQAKEGAGFSALQVDRFEALTDDLLDLPRQAPNYRRTYHDKMLRRIKLFKETYRKLFAPRLVIDYYYITAIDAEEDKDCGNSVTQIVQTVKKHFSRAEVHPFHFINAARLFTQLFERPAFEKNLQCVEIMDGTEGYIAPSGILRLAESSDFIGVRKSDFVRQVTDSE